jgi:hypothetical protein
MGPGGLADQAADAAGSREAAIEGMRERIPAGVSGPRRRSPR